MFVREAHKEVKSVYKQKLQCEDCSLLSQLDSYKEQKEKDQIIQYTF